MITWRVPALVVALGVTLAFWPWPWTAALVIVVNTVFAQPLPSFIGLAITATGFPAYRFWSTRKSRRGQVNQPRSRFSPMNHFALLSRW